MTSLKYKGKEVESMSQSELIACVKALFQKLKDKHHMLEGAKIMAAQDPMDRKAEMFMNELKKRMKK